MAEKLKINREIKRIYNRKIIYPYNTGLWFTILFSLVAIAPIVIAALLQYFTFTFEGAQYKLTALDFVMGLFKKESGNLNLLLQIIANTKYEGQMASIMPNALKITIAYVIPVLLCILAFISVIMVFIILKMLITGRLRNWKAAKTCSVWMTVFAILAYGLGVGFAFLFNSLTKGAVTFDNLYLYIYAGTNFVCSFILWLIYFFGFKHRIFLITRAVQDFYIKDMTYGLYDASTFNLMTKNEVFQQVYDHFHAKMPEIPVSTQTIEKIVEKEKENGEVPVPQQLPDYEKYINDLVERRVKEEIAKLDLKPQIIQQEPQKPIVVTNQTKVVEKTKPVKIVLRTGHKVRITRNGKTTEIDPANKQVKK